MKLIDADALIESMEENPPVYGCDMDRVINAIKDAPEAKPKCRDCMFWDQYNGGVCEQWEKPTKHDEYCCRWF